VALDNQGLLIKLHQSMASRADTEEMLNANRYGRSVLRCCQVLAVEGRLVVAVIRQGEALFTSLGPALQRATVPSVPSVRQRGAKRWKSARPPRARRPLLRTGGITLLAEAG